jgi:hypothetical protein
MRSAPRAGKTAQQFPNSVFSKAGDQGRQLIALQYIQYALGKGGSIRPGLSHLIR